VLLTTTLLGIDPSLGTTARGEGLGTSSPLEEHGTLPLRLREEYKSVEVDVTVQFEQEERSEQGR
jgi:hypothetical protein